MQVPAREESFSYSDGMDKERIEEKEVEEDEEEEEDGEDVATTSESDIDLPPTEGEQEIGYHRLRYASVKMVVA